MDLPSPPWNPTTPLGIQVVDCEGWAHIAYVAAQSERPTCEDSDDVGTDWWNYNVMNVRDHEDAYGRSGFGKCGYGKILRESIQIDGQTVWAKFKYKSPDCDGEVGGRVRWIDEKQAHLCYEEEDRGSITGGGGDQATIEDLGDEPIGETLGDVTRSSALGGSWGIGQAARWYARGPATDVPDPNWLTFDPIIGLAPPSRVHPCRRARLRVA